MASITKIVPIILKWEGGYVNDKDDKGGATNRGVTLETYKLYKKRKGEPDPGVRELKKMSSDEWMDILRLFYWDKCKGDDIYSQSVADMLVDFAWHSGVKKAVTTIQKIVGVKEDGIFGIRTLTAVNGMDAHLLFDNIKKERVEYLKYICKMRPANAKFKKGWLNRVNSIEYEA